MRLPLVLDELVRAEGVLADSFRVVSLGHPEDADVHVVAMMLATECEELSQQLADLAGVYSIFPEVDPDPIQIHPVTRARTGPLGLLRDLQELHTLADHVAVTSAMVRQAALTLDDRQLAGISSACRDRAHVQMEWLRTELDRAAPQALIAS